MSVHSVCLCAFGCVFLCVHVCVCTCVCVCAHMHVRVGVEQKESVKPSSTV